MTLTLEPLGRDEPEVLSHLGDGPVSGAPTSLAARARDLACYPRLPMSRGPE